MKKIVILSLVFFISLTANEIIIDTSSMDKFLEKVEESNNTSKSFQDEITDLNNKKIKEERKSEIGQYNLKNINERIKSLTKYYQAKIREGNKQYIAFPNFTYYQECKNKKCMSNIVIKESILNNAIDSLENKENYEDKLSTLNVVANIHPIKNRVRMLENIEREISTNNSTNSNNLVSNQDENDVEITLYDNQFYKGKLIKISKNKVVLQ